MKRAPLLVLPVLVATACGAPPSPKAAPVPASPAAPPPATAANEEATVPCPAPLDGAALLAAHARAYGDEAAIAALLPRTRSGTASADGAEGKFEVVLDRTRYRSSALLGGLFTSEGIDAQGAWSLRISGVLDRARPGESTDMLFDNWIVRRQFIGAFKAERDALACEPPHENVKNARIGIRYALPEVGSPELYFDVKTGALLASKHSNDEGRSILSTYDAWSPSANGARWVTVQTDHPPMGTPQVTRITVDEAGLRCPSLDPHWPATNDCLAPPPAPLVFAWPGDAPVHVPMTLYLNEIALRAHVGDHDVWALLDSGAGLTAIDTTTEAGAAFKPTIETEGLGSSQKVKAGLGAVEALSVGKLALTHVPVVGLPIPALASFGNRRPDIILGYSLFEGSGVRIDYAKSEVVFAKDGAKLHAANAIAIPVRVVGEEIVADVTLDGVVAPIQLDTGNSGGIDIYQSWADAHEFPGARKSLQVKGRFGAGHDATLSTFFRLAKGALGPIHHDDRVTQILSSPVPGSIAGIAGNELFSHCAAVVFDVPHRTFWVEPPCNRAVPESRAGWRLDRRKTEPGDASKDEHPWIVSAVLDGGSAARAGIKPGDRLLEIGGKQAVLDRMTFEPLLDKPVGTKVPLVLEREGARTRIVLELRNLLAD